MTSEKLNLRKIFTALGIARKKCNLFQVILTGKTRWPLKLMLTSCLRYIFLWYDQIDDKIHVQWNLTHLSLFFAVTQHLRNIHCIKKMVNKQTNWRKKMYVELQLMIYFFEVVNITFLLLLPSADVSFIFRGMNMYGWKFWKKKKKGLPQLSLEGLLYIGKNFLLEILILQSWHFFLNGIQIL